MIDHSKVCNKQKNNVLFFLLLYVNNFYLNISFKTMNIGTIKNFYFNNNSGKGQTKKYKKKK